MENKEKIKKYLKEIKVITKGNLLKAFKNLNYYYIENILNELIKEKEIKIIDDKVEIKVTTLKNYPIKKIIYIKNKKS